MGVSRVEEEEVGGQGVEDRIRRKDRGRLLCLVSAHYLFLGEKRRGKEKKGRKERERADGFGLVLASFHYQSVK